MPRLKLTDIERLLLANQYEILSELKKDADYARMAETLRNGHEWLYRQYFDTLSENLSEDKADHVLTILGIFSDLRDSYTKLLDKSEIDESSINFPGFDGNNEADLLGFADALQKHRNFATTIGPSAKNSHMPTTGIYRRMISKWQELGKPSYPYSREQVLAILEARIHPDNRK